MVVMLKTFCSRCDLARGCIIVGVLWLVTSVLAIVGSVLLMRNLEEIYEYEYTHLDHPIPPELQQIVATILAVFRTTFCGTIIIAVADAVFSIMLALGAFWDKRTLVLLWVVQQVGMLPLWDVLVLASTVLCFTQGHPEVALAALVLVVVRTGVMVYLILVAYSLYRYLRGKPAPIVLTQAV